MLSFLSESSCKAVKKGFLAHFFPSLHVREDWCLIWPCKRGCSLAFRSMRKNRVPLPTTQKFIALRDAIFHFNVGRHNSFYVHGKCFLMHFECELSIILVRDVNNICVMIDSNSIPSLAIGQESISFV